MSEAASRGAPPVEGAKSQLPAIRRALTGPLLVAGEESSPVDGALHVAHLLARRDRLNAHVLTVVRPLTLPAALLADADRDAWQEGRRQRQLAATRQLVSQEVGVSVHLSVSVETGSPAPTIARVARSRGAELVFVGLEAPGAPRRAATEDAALQVTRTAEVPVVAVPPGVALLPRRALVAMDFSEASARAAHAAALTVADGGVITLAHVEPDVEFREMGKEGWGEIYAHGVAGLLEQLSDELRLVRDVEVETIVLRGDAPAALLDLADSGGFELVAAGSQSAPWVEWHLTGSVSTSLLRGARCSVLIAPPTKGRR